MIIAQYGNSINTTTQAIRTQDELCDAYTLGKLDALDGAMACPEMYVVKRLDMELYCAGYESIAGETITTRWFLDNARYVFAGQPVEQPIPAISDAEFEAILAEDEANRADYEDAQWMQQHPFYM